MSIDSSAALFIGFGVLIVMQAALVAISFIQRSKLKRIEKRQQQLEAEFSAVVSGNLDLGRRVLRLGKIMHHIERSQNDLKHGQISDKAIDQASTMIRNGIAVDEVMATCDISRGEAELLSQMLGRAQLH